MSDVWALRALRWAYVAFIAAASGVAIAQGLRGVGEAAHSGHVVLALAIPELIAALLFLVEPLEVLSAAALVLIYLAAAALSLAGGDLLAPLRFLYFAATAIAVIVLHRARRPAGRAAQPATITPAA